MNQRVDQKMKKVLSLLLVLVMIISLVACGESNTKAEGGETKIENQELVAKTYDVDLTQLSSTMIYSEVYNMMTTPQNYIGKKVRMNGQFALYQATDANGNPVPEQIYFACVVADATACCSQGLEFVLAGNHTYPNDYPELGSEIVVSGTFETYDENGYLYCHLVDSELE